MPHLTDLLIGFSPDLVARFVLAAPSVRAPVRPVKIPGKGYSGAMGSLDARAASVRLAADGRRTDPPPRARGLPDAGSHPRSGHRRRAAHPPHAASPV